MLRAGCRHDKRGPIGVTVGPHSIIGADGILSSRDQIPPPTADQAVLATLKRRLEQDDVILACMNCRDWKSHTIFSRYRIPPSARSAGPADSSAQTYEADAYAVVVLKRKKNEEERAIEQRLLRNANIVLSSGKKAVIALSARGVGPRMLPVSLRRSRMATPSTARSSRHSGTSSRRTGTGHNGSLCHSRENLKNSSRYEFSLFGIVQENGAPSGKAVPE